MFGHYSLCLDYWDTNQQKWKTNKQTNRFYSSYNIISCASQPQQILMFGAVWDSPAFWVRNPTMVSVQIDFFKFFHFEPKKVSLLSTNKTVCYSWVSYAISFFLPVFMNAVNKNNELQMQLQRQHEVTDFCGLFWTFVYLHINIFGSIVQLAWLAYFHSDRERSLQNNLPGYLSSKLSCVTLMEVVKKCWKISYFSLYSNWAFVGSGADGYHGDCEYRLVKWWWSVGNADYIDQQVPGYLDILK